MNSITTTTDNKLRLRFSKTGNAIYMSHLDLMETMKRAFIRAGIKLKYSQGFNPHPFISIALPLPVGISSSCELLDFKCDENLLPDGLLQIINDVLPKGIEVTGIYPPVSKFAEIKWLKIDGEFKYSTIIPNINLMLTNRFNEKSIIILKKTKRGVSEIDIAPHIHEILFSGDTVTNSAGTNVIKMSAIISAQEPSINPQNLLSALHKDYEELSPQSASFHRVEIYDACLKAFR